MGCKMININAGASACTENFAGIGTTVYVGFYDDLKTPGEYDENLAQFTPSSFTFNEGKGFYKMKIQKGTGSVTATNNGPNKGFSNVGTFTLDADLENAAAVERTLNNRRFFMLLSDGKAGSFYALYDPESEPTLELSNTTGDAPDSDRGHTYTVTCNPMLYPECKWKGTPTIAADADDSLTTPVTPPAGG